MMFGDTPDRNSQHGCPPSAQHLITDVLVEIFLQCSLGDGLLPEPTLHSSPLNLGRVCHSWRQVALSTPQLWSSLRIPDTWNSPLGMTEWLKRSASLPLTVILNDHDRLHGSSLYRIGALSILLANAYRWKDVWVLADIELVLLFLNAVEPGAPLLESLEIHDCEANDEFLAYTELDLPKYPRLKSLHLPGSVQVVLHHRNITLRNLRIIDFESQKVNCVGVMSMDDYLTLLTLSPNLDEASFAITGSTPMKPMDDIIEHKIRQLCIFVPVGLNIGSFSHHLRLPHLSNLRIEDTTNKDPREFPFNNIKSLLRRSQAPLTRLDIFWDIPPMVQSDGDVVDILRLTPNIRSVSLHRLPVSDVLLRALAQPTTLGETASCLCPKLTEISVVRGGKFSESAVKDMILFREKHRGTKPFKRLRLLDCGLKWSILRMDEEVQNCIARGLSVRIRRLNP
ncbi:hypothetical protein BD410DRAFT_631107 [Rickenella mellea]|uniref:Uncharacterized protein n=1 Tax=Rickenella mellea TaxID=50990 RepID=A0A4Y7QD72_9AGAM|nr:hypothetical protein BD410DRAFT_631107 [Rickenella mellea]